MTDKLEPTQADVARLPYPKSLEDAATLAVETAFQEMGQRGAFDEHGLPESGQIFGKACAYTALKQLCEAAINETMPDAAAHIAHLERRLADAERDALERAAKVAEQWPDRIEGGGIADAIRALAQEVK